MDGWRFVWQMMSAHLDCSAGLGLIVGIGIILATEVGSTLITCWLAPQPAKSDDLVVNRKCVTVTLCQAGSAIITRWLSFELAKRDYVVLKNKQLHMFLVPGLYVLENSKETIVVSILVIQDMRTCIKTNRFITILCTHAQICLKTTENCGKGGRPASPGAPG